MASEKFRSRNQEEGKEVWHGVRKLGWYSKALNRTVSKVRMSWVLTRSGTGTSGRIPGLGQDRPQTPEVSASPPDPSTRNTRLFPASEHVTRRDGAFSETGTGTATVKGHPWRAEHGRWTTGCHDNAKTTTGAD